MDDVYEKFRDRLITSLNLVWLDPAPFSDAMHSPGAALNNYWPFIAGTVRPIAWPTRNQNLMFSGQKRVHCIQFSGLFLVLLIEELSNCFMLYTYSRWSLQMDYLRICLAPMKERRMMLLCLQKVGWPKSLLSSGNQMGNLTLPLVIQHMVWLKTSLHLLAEPK